MEFWPSECNRVLWSFGLSECNRIMWSFWPSLVHVLSRNTEIVIYANIIDHNDLPHLDLYCLSSFLCILKSIQLGQNIFVACFNPLCTVDSSTIIC